MQPWCLFGIFFGQKHTAVRQLSIAGPRPGGSSLPPSPWEHVGGQARLALRWQKLEGLLGQVGGAEALFMHLHGQQGAQDTFWLDRYTAVPTVLAPPPLH